MERLLSAQEIKEILKESKQEIYLDQNLFHLGFEATTILRISLKKRLILVKGNSDTGFDHILERHSYTSIVKEWRGGRIQDPSRFQLETIPILDFLAIADKIYNPENLNPEKNKRSDEFDLYEKELIHKDGVTEKYRLLTYKNTPIIHTLFPTRSKFNRSKAKKLNYLRGAISAKRFLHLDLEIFELPFLDQNDVQRYKALLIYDSYNNLKKQFLQINSKEGLPQLSLFISEEELNHKIEFHNLFFMNEIKENKIFENKILEIEKKTIDPFELKLK